MARLSGLASEHHPEGPGDGPRRRRGRKSNTPSVDPTHSAKRAASPTMESASAYNKRVKRVAINDSQQLVRESEAAAFRSSQADGADLTAMPTRAESSSRPTRRHSEPLVSNRDDEDDTTISSPPATQPLAGLTPHLNRIGAPRGRITAASRRSRQSMPAQLQLHNVDETDGMNEHQFAPLSAVLDGRMKRRLRRSHLSEEVNEIEQHKKGDSKMKKAIADLSLELRDKDQAIRELTFQLEANRMGRIDMAADQVIELEQQLELANQELNELKASSVYEGSDAGDFDYDEDEDIGQTLINPEDLNITAEQLEVEPHPNGFYASRALALSSQVTFQTLSSVSQTTFDSLGEASQVETTIVPDKISDQAVKRFDMEFGRLTTELASAQGALRLIAVELQNLHIIPAGASSKDIITALRHAFEDAREVLEKHFPNSTIGLTNTELIQNMITAIQDIMIELSEKVTIAERHNQTEKLLRAEVDGLVDLLTTSDHKNRELQAKWFKLDRANEEKEKLIIDLEERVVNLGQAVDSQDALIQEKDVKILGLDDELEDKETALIRLRDALDTYRADVSTLTDTVTRLELAHAARIVEMEREHAAVVLDLQQELDIEMGGRGVAEGEANQKTEYIEELEKRLGVLETDILDFTTQMTRLRELLEKETAKGIATEQQRDDYQQISYSRENEIENLKELIAELESQLEEFRNNLDSERTQRVQTEASLDEADEKINEFTDQLHNAGIQANELRSKLFQVQQEKEMTINILKDEANVREEDLQDLLAAETQRRQIAEEKVASLDAQCTRLLNSLTITENSLEEITRDLDTLEADRNEKIAHGNRQRDDLAKKLAALENTSASTITTLQANITDLTNDLAAHRATIQDLKDAGIEANQEFTDTLADRDATIGVLEVDLATARNANEELIAENKSLATRVENEAHELLNIMGAHAQEANGLRQAIAAKDATIVNLQNNATQRATEFTEELSDKVQEIEEMRIMGDHRAEIIFELQNQIQDLKERFRIAEDDTRTTMDALTESRRRLQEENDHLSAALLKRNAEALKAIQEMKVKGVEVKTTGAGDLHKVFSGKITKVTEKVKIGRKKAGGIRKSKRQWDSGFGVDESVEADEDLDEALVEA